MQFLIVAFCSVNITLCVKIFRIQEQLRRIKRNQEKEKLQPVKKKKEKPPNNVRLLTNLDGYHLSAIKSKLK